MAKKNNPEVEDNAVAANSKIEAIKNLIFGENIAEYNNEFEALKGELAAKRQELMEYVDSTRKELMTAIDNLSTDVNIRISDLEEALNDKADDLDHRKMNRTDLGDLLIQMGQKIKA